MAQYGWLLFSFPNLTRHPISSFPIIQDNPLYSGYLCSFFSQLMIIMDPGLLLQADFPWLNLRNSVSTVLVVCPA